MNNECSIVKDLLPLYAENMTSKDTAEFVKTHLEGCESCRNEYTRIKEPPAAQAEITTESAPLRAVKKRLTRKKILIAAGAVLATVLLIFALVMFFDSRPVTTVYHDWSESTIYTDDDIAAAADAVEACFITMDGCKLYSLTYAGDEKSRQELAYINQFGNYDHCIVFDSVFRSPLFGGGGWTAHEIYTWNWYLGRTNGGEWEVVQKGYA
jgi:hypothetical protein